VPLQYPQDVGITGHPKYSSVSNAGSTSMGRAWELAVRLSAQDGPKVSALISLYAGANSTFVHPDRPRDTDMEAPRTR
jgi:hypothetical protein